MIKNMNEQHIRQLIGKIDLGYLSRNKDFEAFRDPEVREAKRRQARLASLIKLLATPEMDELEVALEEAGGRSDTWKLECRWPKWNLWWSAWLKDFEIDFLLSHPRVRERLGA